MELRKRRGKRRKVTGIRSIHTKETRVGETERGKNKPEEEKGKAGRTAGKEEELMSPVE